MLAPVFDLLQYIKRKILHPYIFFSSIFFLLVSWIFTSLHYMNLLYGNSLSWISWILAIITFFYSFLPFHLSLNHFVKKIQKSDYIVALYVIVLYFATHIWNFATAPWNQNGLFDDAAWDIYFAKIHAFNGPFQATFFDNVGYISREVVFHYYISVFFKLFGYNLLVFNISLLVLGFVTVFFTTFIIHRIFKNISVTLISAIIINFFPLHFVHIFMGHRYAIAAPLMVVSLYFLYQAFIHKSFFRAAISALFAALCWGSAIMGKQYILGLAFSASLILIFGKSKWISKDNIATGIIWILGFFIATIPLLAYILFNYDNYILRERGLLQDFISVYESGGLPAIQPFFNQISELFLAEHSFRRQFLSDFYIIPIAYYALLMPGFLIAFMKKRFEIVFLSVIPVLGAFVSGSYDFRVLLAVPLWIICIAYYLDFIFKSLKTYNKNLRIAFIAISLFFFLLGLIPSVVYLWKVSINPHHIYLLPHKDVAVSRLVQDIVVGSNNPKSSMKHDELNRSINLSNVSYDTFVCPFSAYAIMHLYLQNYKDKSILSFCNQGIQLLKDPKEIISNNVSAIESYKSNWKDLKLVWEISSKTSSIINQFSEYKKYGSEETIADISDGEPFSLYILTIKNRNISTFQQEVVERYSQQHL